VLEKKKNAKTIGSREVIAIVNQWLARGRIAVGPSTGKQWNTWPQFKKSSRRHKLGRKRRGSNGIHSTRQPQASFSDGGSRVAAAARTRAACVRGKVTIAGCRFVRRINQHVRTCTATCNSPPVWRRHLSYTRHARIYFCSDHRRRRRRHGNWQWRPAPANVQWPLTSVRLTAQRTLCVRTIASSELNSEQQQCVPATFRQHYLTLCDYH